MLVESQADSTESIGILIGVDMIAFEIMKNGNLLRTIEAGDEGMLMAIVQWIRYVDREHKSILENAAVTATFNGFTDEQATTMLTENINVGDTITIRVFNTNDEDDGPKGSGVPIVHQPPELPPGRKLFSN